MSALDTLERIAGNQHLAEFPFRYCLVDSGKIPHTFQGVRARPNASEDFCSLEEISLCERLEEFEGIGVSVNASGICAIDVDKCFSSPFDVTSGDRRAIDTIEAFNGKAYVEFSFSGKGLRVLFVCDEIDDYVESYYVKNDRTKIEYYQPKGSARYVTLTGVAISDAPLKEKLDKSVLLAYLDKYMKRPKASAELAFTHAIEQPESIPMDQLLLKVKSLYLRDIVFQDLWFGQAPGSGSNESQLDFHLLSVLYREITKNKEDLMELFEQSPYFSTKDRKHVWKWQSSNHRYFNYMYDRLG